MTPYWLIYSALSFLAFTSRVRHYKIKGFFQDNFNLLTFFLFLFFSIFIGFRFDVGGDWENYLNIYLEQADKTVSTNIFIADPSFLFLNWLSYEIGIGYHGLNFLCALIFTYGVLKFCRYLPRPNVAILVSFPYLINIVGMGYQRQSVAIGIMLLAFISLFKYQNFRFFLLVTLAATFHKSAIIFYPLMIFSTRSNKFLLFLLMSLGILGGYFLLVEARLGHMIDNYIYLQKSSTGAMYRVLMLVVPALIFIIYRKQFNILDIERRVWTLFSFGSFILFIGLLSLDVSTTIDRLALYILPIQLFVFSHLANIFKPLSRPIINLGIIVYYGIVLFVWANFGTHSEEWIPYDNAIIRLLIGDRTYFGV